MLVYLKKETRDSEEQCPKKPTINGNPGFFSPIENRVKTLGSLDAVLNEHTWDANPRAKTYAREYAQWYYWKPDSSKSPYRHGSVPFPSVPKNDVRLTVKVEMRPASGLARVEFVPQGDGVFMGRSVAFDYSRMEPVLEDDMPKPELRWPETLHFETTSDSGAFDDPRIQRFIELPSDVSTEKFISHLDDMKKTISSPVQDIRKGQFVFFKRIDENGETRSFKGAEMIAKISSRIANQYNAIVVGDVVNDTTRQYLVRSSWLWAKTPEVVTQRIYDYLRKHIHHRYDATWNHLLESASRCFTMRIHFRLLCTAIYKRSINGTGNCFPIHSARTLIKILSYREEGWRGLDRTMANHFAYRASELICGEVENRNIKQKFFQGALLFLALLRYRIADADFLDPKDATDASLIKKVEACMHGAKDIVREQPGQLNKADRIDALIQGTIDFIYSKGQSGIIVDLAEFAGE